MKELTVYPSGHGRNGERHLSKKETSVELYKISFKLGKERYVLWPDELMVTVGGDKHGVRLDLLIADLLHRVDRLEARIKTHTEALRRRKPLEDE